MSIRIQVSIALVSLLFLTFSSVSAATPSSAEILCVKRNVISIKAKCAKGEKRLTLANLSSVAAQTIQVAQGPVGEKGDQGPQGATGPQGSPGPTGIAGPTGAPGGFDFAGCYKKSTGLLNANSNQLKEAALSCNSMTTQYLQSSSFAVGPQGSSTNKPYIQSKELVLDASNKVPIGVKFTAFQALNTGNNPFSVQADIICCLR